MSILIYRYVNLYIIYTGVIIKSLALMVYIYIYI